MPKTKSFTSIYDSEEHRMMLVQKCKVEWSALAKETVNVQLISTTLYAFGSELACLRLFAAFKGTPNTKVGYSLNMKTWYFSKEMQWN
jgi:hypothetical protein